MFVINATPHPVVVFRELDKGKPRTKITYPTSGHVARLVEQTQPGRNDLVSECIIKEYLDVAGIPDEKPGTVYIVSVLVFLATSRLDVVCPDTGPDSVIRDEKGRITGVKRFMSKK